MPRMLQPLRVAALLTLAVPPQPTAAVVLRSGAAAPLALGRVAVADSKPAEAIPSNAEIKGKWDKMDKFMEIMFTIACKWKHGKDVRGLAAEKLASGELAIDEVEDFKKKTQAGNLVALKEACGKIVAKGKSKCRRTCALRWGKVLAERSECDAKCVEVYGRFETGCMAKAGHLQQVYSAKLKQTSARKRCHEGHCKEFPTAWMKGDVAAMKTEVDTRCQDRCTEASLKLRCEQKWQLEVDFLMPKIKTACFNEGEVAACFGKKKSTASAKQATCSSTGESTCASQHSGCNQRGNTKATFDEAKAFCDSRKKMCLEQVSKDCSSEYRQALDAARQQCEQEDSTAMDTCVTDAVEAKEKATVATCVSESGPTCKGACQKKCDVGKMTTCLKELEDGLDATEHFCTDLWRLLHESSEVDPITGDPIVLLAPRRAAAVAAPAVPSRIA